MGPDAIEGEFIVILTDGRGPDDVERVARFARARGGRVLNVWDDGFSAALPEAALADVRSDPDVEYVSENGQGGLRTTQSDRSHRSAEPSP